MDLAFFNAWERRLVLKQGEEKERAHILPKHSFEPDYLVKETA
jgi:hypothetical protein